MAKTLKLANTSTCIVAYETFSFLPFAPELINKGAVLVTQKVIGTLSLVQKPILKLLAQMNCAIVMAIQKYVSMMLATT